MSYSYSRTENVLQDFKELVRNWIDLQSQDKHDNWTICCGTFGLNQIAQTKLHIEISAGTKCR
jgi:hypothetical protein